MKKITTLFTLTVLSLTLFSQLPSYVPTNGLVCFYSFNGNANDVSGNGNNGTVNGCTLTTDRFGNPNSSYYFNGINNYIEIPNNSYLQITGPISITLWVYPDTVMSISQTQGMILVDKTTVGGTDGYLLDMGENNGGVPGNEYRSRFIGANSVNQPRSTEFYTIDHVWWNITLTYDGSQVIFYLNGSVDTIIPLSGSQSINTNPVLIGGNSLLNGTWFYGKMDDIGIYNRCLTPSEVSQLYTQSTCSVYDTVYTSVVDTLIIHSNLTGVSPPNNTNTLTVYPNPTSSQVIINTGNYSSMSGYTLKVINDLGQSVFQSLINQQVFNESIQSWGGNGTYFIEIFDTSNTLIDKRVIVIE